MAKKKGLDERHFKAMEMLLQGTFTMEEIAEEVGVSRRMLYYWMDNDEFKTTYNNMIINTGKNRLNDVMNAMYDAAIDERSAAAAKLILEAHDILNKKKEVDVNVNHGNSVDLQDIKNRLKQLQKEKNQGE
jgi:AcrR family transcriptional regulator